LTAELARKTGAGAGEGDYGGKEGEACQGEEEQTTGGEGDHGGRIAMSSEVHRGERRVHLALMIRRDSTTYISVGEVREKKRDKDWQQLTGTGLAWITLRPCHGERVALVFITTFATVQAAHGREADERPTERSWVDSDWPALPIEDTS
jgi:hypothetical protein